MVWNDNKQPVEFGRYRTAAAFFGRKRGWYFHTGLSEHARFTTYELINLLKEEKAFLVIDKATWNKAVERYGGKSTPINEKRALVEQRQKLSKQIAARTEEAKTNGVAAQKMIGKDPQGARNMLAKNVNLKKDVDNLSGHLKVVNEKLAKLK